MNTFKDLWRSLSHEEKESLAGKLETSTAYLSQIANGHRNPGKHFQKIICMETELPESAFQDNAA